MRFEVLITARAQSDLNEARAFIAKHAPEAAERWYFGFLEALLALEQSPRIGQSRRKTKAFRLNYASISIVRATEASAGRCSRSSTMKCEFSPFAVLARVWWRLMTCGSPKDDFRLPACPHPPVQPYY